MLHLFPTKTVIVFFNLLYLPETYFLTTPRVKNEIHEIALSYYLLPGLTHAPIIVSLLPKSNHPEQT